MLVLCYTFYIKLCGGGVMLKENIDKAMKFYKEIEPLHIEAWKVEAMALRLKDINKDNLSPEFIKVYDRLKEFLESRGEKSFEEVDPYCLQEDSSVFDKFQKEVFHCNLKQDDGYSYENLRLWGLAEMYREGAIPQEPTYEYFVTQINLLKTDKSLSEYCKLNLRTAFSRLVSRQKIDSMIDELRINKLIGSPESTDPITLVVETCAFIGFQSAIKRPFIERVFDYANAAEMASSINT